jgi:hypothetical protein
VLHPVSSTQISPDVCATKDLGRKSRFKYFSWHLKTLGSLSLGGLEFELATNALAVGILEV